MEIPNTRKNLLEAALDFRGGHAAFTNSIVQVPARTKLHHNTPLGIVVLHQVDGFHNIGLAERRGDAKFRSELLHIVSFGFLIAPWAEFLGNRIVST